MSAAAIRIERLARYRRALGRTHELIEPNLPGADMSLAAIRVRAVERQDRLRVFLARIGDPHLQFPVFHVTGTSGKGSTSIAIAAILQAGGKKTGVYTSPYLQSATEKLQIDGRLIDPIDFADHVDELLDLVEGLGEPPLSYAEFWLALVSLAFVRHGIDAAVIEVGAGGRFDITNLVEPAVSVITSVGLDHIETLGPTIREIAWNKAGIVKSGAPVVTGVVDPVALAEIEAEAAISGSEITQLIEDQDFVHLGRGGTGERWRDGLGREFETGMFGRFQVGNAANAARAVALAFPELDERDTIAAGLLRARMPGRFEIVQLEPLIVLDGAHNAEKIAALAAELPVFVQAKSGGHLIAVVGALAAKDHRAIVEAISARVDALILTSPHVLAKPAAAAASLAEEARKAGFTGLIEVSANPRQALALARELARPGDAVLVTGSLYLLGNVRGEWFPDDEVILQGTPWPVVAK